MYKTVERNVKVVKKENPVLLDKIKHNAEQSEDKNEDSKPEPDFSEVPF